MFPLQTDLLSVRSRCSSRSSRHSNNSCWDGSSRLLTVQILNTITITNHSYTTCLFYSTQKYFFLTLIFSFWLHSSFSWLQYERNYLCIVYNLRNTSVCMSSSLWYLAYYSRTHWSSPPRPPEASLSWKGDHDRHCDASRGTMSMSRVWPGLRQHAVDHPHVGLSAALPRHGSLRLPRGCQGGERPHEVLMRNS